MTTSLRKCVSLALMVASLALGAASSAVGQRRAQRADYDRRASMNLRAAPNQVQLEALAALREDLEGSLLESVDLSSGVTHSLFNPVGKLTLPNPGDPLDIAVSFINDNLALLGLEEGDVDEIRVCDIVYSGVSGATHVYLCQWHKGVEVFNAQLHVNVSSDGSILSVNNSFVPGLKGKLKTRVAGIQAEDACMAVANHLGIRARRALRQGRASSRRRPFDGADRARARVGARRSRRHAGLAIPAHNAGRTTRL